MRRVHGIFWLPFARLHGIFLARTAILRNFAAFSVPMELGIFRVAKSSGEGRKKGGSALKMAHGLVCAETPQGTFTHLSLSSLHEMHVTHVLHRETASTRTAKPKKQVLLFVNTRTTGWPRSTSCTSGRCRTSRAHSA